MHIPPPPGPGWTFNSPPGWPVPPAGWVPDAGWAGPEPSWPVPPPGWTWWIRPETEHVHPVAAPAHLTAAQAPPTAGRVRPATGGDPGDIGPYRIIGRLGAGGMGVVYAGVDRQGRQAAVKLIHASYAHDPEFRTRFAREIDIVSRVRGLCTASVLAADPHAQLPWLATEYVPGPTLDELIAERGPLPEEELRSLAAGLAEALVAIHRADVIHRDLKPTNVLLSPAGPRVVDFGIARALDATAITRSGMVIGSPGWISPEEYHDEPVTPAVDVYGWGLLVAYAASGKAPYGLGRAEVLALRTLNEPVDTQPVPDALRDLVDAALSKEPGGRPSAQEVLADVLGAAGSAQLTKLLEETWVGRITPEP
ncbi:serine/threonine protein kinase, partial [Nonomuraea sp. NN258]|uniref:serine/threonine-protein kinase n=1 Tax=Nonomuraea antri TaxID=2730852 RepID=UPI001568371D